jgi:hypothetical protein
MRWRVDYLDKKVEEQIESLSREMRKDFERIVELIVEFGLEEVHPPLVKHLEGPLWEIRMRDRKRHCSSGVCDGFGAAGSRGSRLH